MEYGLDSYSPPSPHRNEPPLHPPSPLIPPQQGVRGGGHQLPLGCGPRLHEALPEALLRAPPQLVGRGINS